MNVWMWWDSQQILQKDVTHSHNASNFINLMKSNSSCSISMPSQLHTNQGTHDKLFMTRHSKTDYFNKKMNQKQCLRLASFVPVPFIPFFVSLFPGTTASRLLDAWCVDRLGVSGSPDSVLLQNFEWPQKKSPYKCWSQKVLSECQPPMIFDYTPVI